ncbi:Prospero homeobox protein 1 [Taenia solium]|eukprot:TsM_000584000 transcript=TsM_000584000 gene=TsM_000584000
MASSRNENLFTHSALNQRTSFEPDFSTLPQVNNRLQFYMSPLKAVYVVPPPSLLLNAPMLMQANLPLWSPIKDEPRGSIWNQGLEVGQGGDDFSQIMELSMRQIENRLSKNGIGKANIWKQQQKTDRKVFYTPLKRKKNCSLDEPVNLSSKNAKTMRAVANSKITAFQCLLKDEILSGNHLRKAKLMFFYARYPSSAYLKHFFPEVTFNRYNTAQLIKWFSNFREFFYINIERYARALVAEGVQSSQVIRLIPKFGLYRTLILHYNRGMESETPAEFIAIVERAILEFFAAIIAGADTHSAWKKKIYKTIAQFDQSIPEHFRYLKC